ncbi:uncharacterized protein [Nicotiana tomentosiformis]|uniref:uncharacterized protein n=1 Tax=Nicotiana tomentosiformis TaxID=4098 RepID=UPI00388C7E5C
MGLRLCLKHVRGLKRLCESVNTMELNARCNSKTFGMVTPTSRRTLSNAVGGPLTKKTPAEIVTILDELSEDANKWPSEIAERRRSTGVHQVDTNTSVQVQLDAMAKEIRKLTLASIHNEPHAACDLCGRGHPTHECQATMEEVNVMGNYNFNAMGQKHPGFSWSSLGGIANSWQQNNSGFQGAPHFVNQPRLQFQPQQPIQSGLEDLMKSFIVKTGERLDAHGAAIKELGPYKKTEKKKDKKGAEKKKEEETSRREEYDDVRKHMPALPFPQKLYREKLDKQFERFLDMLRQVNVNLPFTEVLSQMPAYAKFFKEILTKKRKIEETSVVNLTKHCSAIL